MSFKEPSMLTKELEYHLPKELIAQKPSDRRDQSRFADTNAGGIGVAHNGNLTNSIYLRNKLVEEGAIFYTTSDTETIVQLIAKSKRPKTIDKIVDAIFQIQGGYALVMLTQNSLIGVREIGRAHV